MPDDSDWLILEEYLGMSAEESIPFDWRGTSQGSELKASPTEVLSWNGTNSTGFTALPTGYIVASGGGSVAGTSNLSSASSTAAYWSRTPIDDNLIIIRLLHTSQDNIKRDTTPKFFGQPVRCIKD